MIANCKFGLPDVAALTCKYLIEKGDYTPTQCAKLYNVHRMTVIRRLRGETAEGNKGGRRQTPACRKRRVCQVKRAYNERNKAGKRRYPSLRSLSRRLGDSFSKSSIHRLFKQESVVHRKKIKGPWHTKEQVRARLSFSRGTLRNLRRYVFVDEAWIDINGQGGGYYVFPGEDVDPRDVVDAKNLHPIKVLIFGAIGQGFRFVKVLPVRQRTDDEDGWRVTADRYKRLCLQAIVPHLLATGSILVQDGAAVHKAGVVRQYLANKGVEWLEDWPAKSPDLNPIENLWSIVKRRVAQQGPRTLVELQATVLQEYNDTPQQVIENLVASFPERLKRCVRVKGHLTNSRQQ